MIYARDRGRCGICGDEVEPALYSIDHVVPLVQGGAHEPSNWQLAHRRCNSRKNGWRERKPADRDSLIADYRRKRGLTLERLGELLGVRFETIWRWENKKRSPPARMVKLALDGLDKEQGWQDE